MYVRELAGNLTFIPGCLVNTSSEIFGVTTIFILYLANG